MPSEKLLELRNLIISTKCDIEDIISSISVEELNELLDSFVIEEPKVLVK